ncbi:MAG: hypothetical protein U5K51_13730 [Flavobacteriaceae bacterium]|nr:hypothetical protein [Flavobacteriaceae bacterium]
MRRILVVGGSSGIGKAIIMQNLPTCKIVNFSRTAPAIDHVNLEHHTIDILADGASGLKSTGCNCLLPG